MSDRLDSFLSRYPVPPVLCPRTYLGLNLIERLLEENHFDFEARVFRIDYRPRLLHLRADTAETFRHNLIDNTTGNRLYGIWWGPGLLSRRTSDAWVRIRRVIFNADFSEIFE